jgi:hypothetical protein
MFIAYKVLAFSPEHPLPKEELCSTTPSGHAQIGLFDKSASRVIFFKALKTHTP